MKEDEAKEKCFASEDANKRFDFRERDEINAPVHVIFGKDNSTGRCDFSARILTRFPMLLSQIYRECCLADPAQINSPSPEKQHFFHVVL